MSNDSDQKPIEVDFETKEEIANQYANQVIENIEENKKFILSNLDVYDIEVFFDELDFNLNVNFNIILNEEVENGALINTIKRYFNITIDDFDFNDNTITLQPVLDNKFIKMV